MNLNTYLGRIYFVCFCVVMASVAITDEQVSLDKRIERAQEIAGKSLRGGKHAEATKVFEELLVTADTSTGKERILNAWADELVKAGQEGAAAKIWERALRETNSAAAGMSLSKKFFVEGRVKEAEAMVTEAAQLGSVSAKYDLLRFRWSAAQWPETYAIANELLGLDDDNIDGGFLPVILRDIALSLREVEALRPEWDSIAELCKKANPELPLEPAFLDLRDLAMLPNEGEQLNYMRRLIKRFNEVKLPELHFLIFCARAYKVYPKLTASERQTLRADFRDGNGKTVVDWLQKGPIEKASPP